MSSKQAPRVTSATDVMIGINISSEWRNDLASGAAQDITLLAGNIEFLIGETLLVLGSFEGALLLIPAVEILIDAAQQLQREAPRIDVDFLGSGGRASILLKHKGPPALYVVSAGAERSPPARGDLIENAAREAVSAFLRDLAASFPMGRWHGDALRLVEMTRRTWPTCELP